MRGDITENQKIEYKKVDITITECMLAAEKQLEPPDMVNKSAKQIQILATVNYYKIIFLKSQGQPVNEPVLQDAQTKLGIQVNSNDPKEIHTLIKVLGKMEKIQRETV